MNYTVLYVILSNKFIYRPNKNKSNICPIHCYVKIFFLQLKNLIRLVLGFKKNYLKMNKPKLDFSSGIFRILCGGMYSSRAISRIQTLIPN